MLLNLRSRKRPVSLSPSAAGGEGQGRGGSFPKQPRNPEFLSGSIRSYPWSSQAAPDPEFRITAVAPHHQHPWHTGRAMEVLCQFSRSIADLEQA